MKTEKEAAVEKAFLGSGAGMHPKTRDVMFPAPTDEEKKSVEDTSKKKKTEKKKDDE